MTKAKKVGITETCSSKMGEEQKLGWGLVVLLLGVVLSFFTVKTGVAFIDWAIGLFVLVTPYFVILPQRSLTKYKSAYYKKLVIGFAVGLPSVGASVLGLLYFGLVLIGAAFQTYSTEIAPLLSRPEHLSLYMMTAIFPVAFCIAVTSVWRKLQLRELFIELPNRSLKQLMLQRRYIATDFAAFARFELAERFLACAYASVFATIIKCYLPLFSVN